MMFYLGSLRTLAPKISVLAALLVAVVFPLSAQTGTASLSGIVTDASEARIVNAVVQAVNVDINVSQTTHSNESGFYSFPSLPPAQYRVWVKAPGFKEF